MNPAKDTPVTPSPTTGANTVDRVSGHVIVPSKPIPGKGNGNQKGTQ